METSTRGAVPPVRRGRLDAVACMVAFLVSLIYLEASFADGYTLPLVIGGACGLLAARLALGLARVRRGWGAWAWRAFSLLAAVHVLAQAPRYATVVTSILR